MKGKLETRRRGALAALAAILAGSAGCSTLKMNVEAPPLPTIPSAENELVRADYMGMTQGKDGRGVLAVRMTNKSSRPLPIGGNQGGAIPTTGDNKAWLVFRGHSDVARFAQTGVKLELTGTGEAKLDVDVPEEGTFELPPGGSKVVLIGFQAAPGEKELTVDLQPLVATGGVHDSEGRLRTLYLTAPIVTAEGLKSRAKEFLESTKFGFQLNSNDL